MEHIYKVARIFSIEMDLKPLPKLGRAADQFRFMGSHSWDFTKQSFLVKKGPDYDFKLCIFS